MASLIDNIANTYDESLSYAVGDYVTYNNLLYSCISATSGVFDETKWKKRYLVELLKSGSAPASTENWKMWAAKGGVDESLYYDLSELLNDELAVRKLMTIHASADYLAGWSFIEPTVIGEIVASSTAMKWIGLRDYVCDKLMGIDAWKTAMLSSDNWEYILKDHVPVMTSNTAPYGEAIKNTVYENQDAFYAFDNNDSTYWESSNAAFPHYLGYKFTNPICVRKVSIEAAIVNTKLSLKNIDIQGSNDGSTWETIKSITMADSTEKQHFEFDNDSYYMQYRIYMTDSYETAYYYSIVHSLQFYGRSLNVSVPVMTSDTAPWGECMESSYYSDSSGNWDSIRAFDKNLSTSAQPIKDEVYTDYFISYKFPKKVKVKKCKWTGHTYWINGANVVFTFAIQGSDDGQTWVKISGDNNVSGIKSPGNGGTQKTIIFDINDSNYQHYRIILVNSTSGYSSQDSSEDFDTAELDFYGVDYSEREFEQGSTMKYIYDHGVELETLNKTNTDIVKDEYLIMAPASSNDIRLVYTNKIDLSQYGIARCVVGDTLSVSEALSIRTGVSTDIPDWWNGTSYNEISSLPIYSTQNSLYLDVSSITDSRYIICGNANVVGRVGTINEWWLE